MRRWLCIVVLLGACGGSTVEDVNLDASIRDRAVADDAEPVSGLFDDASIATPDARPIDTGFLLQRSSLAPVSGTAKTANNQLRGQLRATETLTSSTPAHRLRGGLMPQGQ